MISPGNEDHPFVARWSALVRILLVESSVKLVALSAMQYADYYHGTSCHPGNPRLSRDTGYSERTVRNAWGVMRGLNMADRVRRGVPTRGTADEYTLEIPEGWEDLPVLGPSGGAFTCAFCRSEFNPQGHSVLNKDGSVGWRLNEFVFCPDPRGAPGHGCRASWNKARIGKGAPRWNELDAAIKWEMLGQARGESW